MKTDPRIRIFNHLKNMGCWRSRIDGILYSKGKYILLFDPGDWYDISTVIGKGFLECRNHYYSFYYKAKNDYLPSDNLLLSKKHKR